MSKIGKIVRSAAAIAIGFATFGLAGVIGAGVLLYGRKLLSSLFSFPTPDSAQGKPVYSINPSNDYPAPGDPRPYLFGRPLIYPLLLAKRVEYVDNKQVTYLLLYVCDHLAQLRQLNFDKTPITALASYQMQELLPGDTATLGDFNFYTNDTVAGTELQGGALDVVPFTGSVTFAATGNTVTVNEVYSILESEPFDGVGAGGRFTVSDSASNDVEYTIDTVIDGTHCTVVETPVDETVDCTLNIYKVSLSSSTAYVKNTQDIEEGDDETTDQSLVDLVFDNATSTIKAPLPESWGDFRVGDLIQEYRSDTSVNDGVDFEIIAFSGEYAIVDPPPADDTVNCSLVLVRRRIGPVPLCAPGQEIGSFSINVTAASGLYRTNKKGKLRVATVGLEVQIQEIDDAGNPLGDIISLGETNISGASHTPLRRTLKFTLPSEGRWQAFIARSTPTSDDTSRSDAITLESMTGFITNNAVDVGCDSTGTRLALKLTATSALQNGQDSKISGIWQACHPLLVDGEWTAPQATSDLAPAWAFMRAQQGFEIDLDEYAAADAAWQAAGLEYHAYLSGATTLASATQDALRIGDARPWYDWTRNADSMWRDRLRTEAVWCLHDGNGSVSSMDSRPYGLIPDDIATGIIAQYNDPLTGEEREVQCGDCDTRPETVKYQGVQNRQLAFDLGMRELRRRQRRLQEMTADVLWIHRKVDFGDPVLVQSLQFRMGQIAWAESISSTTLRVQSDFEWHPTLPHQCWIVDRDGVPTGPVDCSRGADDRTVILGSAQTVNLGEDGDDPSVILLGYEGHMPALCLASGIGESDGDYVATVNLVIDDPSIFDDAGDAPADEYPTTGVAPDLEIDDLAAVVTDQTAVLTWTAPDEQIAAVPEYRQVGALSWTQLPPVKGGTTSVELLYGGDYEFQVRALGPGGAVGVASNVATATVTAPALTVMESPTSIYLESTASSFVTPLVTATVVGGTPPYTGSWVLQSGSAAITPASATDPSTVFQTTISGYLSRTSVWRWEATDAAANSAVGSDVPITCVRKSSSGPIP